MLDGLKGATKGMFRDGRFESSADGPTVLTVPKGPPPEQLEKRRPEVEAALAAQFGRPVPLRIVVDDDAPVAARGHRRAHGRRTTTSSTCTSSRTRPPRAPAWSGWPRPSRASELVDE